jgi:hypothetical protein
MATLRPGKTKIKIQRILDGPYVETSKEGTKIDKLALSLHKTRIKLKVAIVLCCLSLTACGIMGLMLFRKP